MKRAGMAALAVAWGVASAGVAQNPPQPPTPIAPAPRADSMRPVGEMPMLRGPMQGQGPEALRMQIAERWSRMVQTELELNDQQMGRVRTAERANQDRHRDLKQREQDLHRAVRSQLQPGEAANNDSLARALDQLAAIRVQHAQSDQQLLRELAFLSPVQRAHYLIMARRFQERIEQIRRDMPRSELEQRRPGMRPGRRGRELPRRPLEDDGDQ